MPPRPAGRQPALPGFGPDDVLPDAADPEPDPPPTPPTTPATPPTSPARTPPAFAARLAPRTRRPSLFDARPDDPPEPLRPQPPAPAAPTLVVPTAVPELAAGEAGKARDLLAAVRALRAVEAAGRPAIPAEADALARFPGFGPVALSLFPNPATGAYKDAAWQARGEELRSLLTPDEYASARRTTFTAFYTPPAVMRAALAALDRLGVPADARVLEPGCGAGGILAHAPAGYRLVAVELDGLSARVARARCPGHEVRHEDFRDSAVSGFDAVVGNVPFADLRLDWHGSRLSLHDYFLVKAADALAPGGVLACVTSHFTLDKQTGTARELLAARADFLAAVRLPSDATKREGTAVVADLLLLRKRAPGEPTRHADDAWLHVAPLAVGGAEVAVNAYFLRRPDMVLGTWGRKDTLYGTAGYSVEPAGDLAEQLARTVASLPELPRRHSAISAGPLPAARFVPPPTARRPRAASSSATTAGCTRWPTAAGPSRWCTVGRPWRPAGRSPAAGWPRWSACGTAPGPSSGHRTRAGRKPTG